MSHITSRNFLSSIDHVPASQTAGISERRLPRPQGRRYHHVVASTQPAPCQSFYNPELAPWQGPSRRHPLGPETPRPSTRHPLRPPSPPGPRAQPTTLLAPETPGLRAIPFRGEAVGTCPNHSRPTGLLLSPARQEIPLRSPEDADLSAAPPPRERRARATQGVVVRGPLTCQSRGGRERLEELQFPECPAAAVSPGGASVRSSARC